MREAYEDAIKDKGKRVAFTFIDGKSMWFVCDEFGRKIHGPSVNFDTIEEALDDFIENG